MLAAHNTLLHVREQQRWSMPPVDANVSAVWVSDSGRCTPSAAVDLIGGLSITGSNTPVVARDPGYCNDRVAMQASISGSRAWRATGLTTGIASSTRPTMYVMARNRTLQTAAGQDRSLVAAGGGSGASEDQHRLTPQSNGSGLDSWQWIRRHNSGNVLATSGDIQDTLPHLFKLRLDASAGDVLDTPPGTQIAAQSGSGATDAITTGFTYAGIGCLASAAANFSDASVWLWIWCIAAPSASYESALMSWCYRTYGTV